MRWLAALAALSSIPVACVGHIGDSGAPAGLPEVEPLAKTVGESGMRRLTSHEYDNTLRDLLGDDTRPGAALLPEDVGTPFDNDASHQVASSALIEGVEMLASDAIDRLLADPQRRDEVVGCTPTGPQDAACFGQFLAEFGRRALRRPLTDGQHAALMTLLPLALHDNDFYTAVAAALRTLLQHPQFLYRVEIGTPVAGAGGLFRLDDWEIATRLSYFLWSSMPDPSLLDRAGAHALSTPEQVGDAAREMLGDARARHTIDRFHALWMGYEQMSLDADLVEAMRTETAALLDRIIFDERRPWRDLFTADETYISDSLAQHYGLPPPGSATPVWTSYGDSGRRGILSQGSFLSAAAKFDDTSPTMRGLLIRTRLFCQDIPPPPPNVNVDDPIPATEGAVCKWDRYAAHRQGGCAKCHDLMDPVGFGLENYDREGRYRTHDDGHPECPIEGKGTLLGIGDFQGPAGLGDLMVSSGLLNRCVVTQLYRYAMGRSELDTVDQHFVDVLLQRAANAADFRFDDLLIAFVTSESFGYRRDEL